MRLLNFFLFKKYWSKHKGRLFSLILSIILFTGTAVFSVLNERTELRRQLHEMYNTYGDYAITVHNVTEEQDEKIREIPAFDRIGIISAVGTISTADKNYTIGSLENEEAENSLHIHLIEGHLPDQSGQIAMPEFILNQIAVNAGIGDSITLEFEDLNNDKSSVTYELSGIIGGNLYRGDMEYISRNDGITVIDNEVEYPTPSVYIYLGDTDELSKYYNYFISYADTSYFLHEDTDNIDKAIEDIWEITNKISYGYKKLIFDLMSGTDDNQDFLTVAMSDNIKIIRITAVFMLIVAAISMFSGVMSIMPQRMESLRLLKSIGMSKKMLLKIFITEFIIFWIIGNALGIALGCTVHELIISLQNMIGIPAYHGYFTEYIISQKTTSPFIMPLVLSLIITFVSLIFPIKEINSMTYYKKNSAKIIHRKASTLSSAFSKMTGTRFLSALSCVSIVIVILSTVFGYCYYTESGKGTTYFSIGKENAEAAYYTVDGIDIKENNIDCAISANTPVADTLAVYDKEYGISNSEIQQLSSSAEVLSWGYYPAMTVIYDENTEAPKQIAQSVIPLNEGWEFYDEFKGNTVYDLSLILINDKMMDMLCGAASDDVILLGNGNNFPYEVGDPVPMMTCLTDDKKHTRLDTMKRFDVKITKQLNLNNVNISENDILSNCGLFNFSNSYAIAMTTESAEKFGFYYPNYSSVMIRFNDNLNDKEMRTYVDSAITKQARVFTIHELEHKARINALSSNANVIVLFVLLFILCIISIWNLLRMNVENNIAKFEIMHFLGLPIFKIKNMLIRNMMGVTVISSAVGVAISFICKIILTGKYDEYYSLLAKQQDIIGNTGFPDVILGLSSSFMEKTDTAYEITVRMEKLKDTFFLENEMWLPNLFIPLLVICAVIILSTLICSISAANKIKIERKCSNDQN